MISVDPGGEAADARTIEPPARRGQFAAST